MRNEDQLNEEAVRSAQDRAHPGFEEEEFAFIRETHKKRPLTVRTVFRMIGSLIAGGLVIGLVAGFAFNIVTGVSLQKTPSTVSIPPDEQLAEGTTSGGEGGSSAGAVPTADGTGTGENEAGGTASEGTVPSGQGQAPEKVIIYVTPTPTPPLTGEERRAAAFAGFDEVKNAFSGVARKAMYSMVTVTGYTSEEDWFNTISLNAKSFSGVIIADNGVNLLVLVEYRAIENSDRIVVTFADGTLADARFQMADDTTGFAVICVPLESISKETMGVIAPAVLGNSFTVHPGDAAIVVGSPGGKTGAFLFGLVTSKGNTVSVEDVNYDLFSTDMYGSRQSSGVLLNTDGEVIGLLTASFSAGDSAVLDAVPVSLVKSLIEHLSNNTPLARTGIYGTDISTGAAMLYDLPAGIYVTALSEESPAFEAGIRVADIITMVDGKAITSMRAYHEKLMEMEPGMTMEVTVERSGRKGMVEYTYTVTAGEQEKGK